MQPENTSQLTKPRVKIVRREVSVLLPVRFPVQNVILDKNLTLLKLSVVSSELQPILWESVANRKACLLPEKTHGYQYLFAVQSFDSYVYRSQINKGHLGGLDKVFKIRDRHHRIRPQILRKNKSLILIPAQS